MVQATLTHRMHIPSGYLFPGRDHPRPAPQPLTGYRSDLITGANVVALMARRQWQVLENHPDPITFDRDLHRRAGTPLAEVIEAYEQFEAANLQAFWESTHYLEITGAMRAADPDLDAYHHARRQRRIRAGDRWHKVVARFLPVMRGQWADVDILLDPFFLHLPATTDRVHRYPGSASRAASLADSTLNRPEPTDLVTALAEADAEDPWRNHYRDHHADHPSRQIQRLENKFNPPPPPPSPPAAP